MFNTIHKKLIAGFSIILMIIIASTSYNLYIFGNTKTHILSIQQNAIASFKYATDMENNIIQVSQYLTDVSATKDTANLKLAEDQYNLYKKNSYELANLNPGYKDKLDELNSEVEKLYSSGKEMADMYVKGNHENANKMMLEFDRLTDSINVKVDDIQKKSETAMNDSLTTIQMHMEVDQIIGTVLALVTIILAFIIAIRLAGGITKPINNFLEIFKSLEKGEGDLTTRINVKSKDELSRMAQSFNKFMDNLENMVINIKKNSAIVTRGSEKLNEGGQQNADGITMVNANMSRAAEDSQRISTSISQVAESLSEIAQASGDSAANVQHISLEVDKINSLAQDGGKIALDAKLEMERTEKISSNTISAAEKLGSQAGEIGKIIETIKAITDQTNLLALNAAIEAARAGEQGRGFGVVAEEIRKLAESNNQSAKTIENMVVNIQDMIKKTIEATTGVDENIKNSGKMVENVYAQLQNIIEGVGNIDDRVKSIAAIAEEQSASTEELSATMESINERNSSITAAMQEVAANLSTQSDTIEELGTTASDLSGSAEQLNSLISKFKIIEK